MKLNGIDISKWQGYIDFDKLEPHIDFIIIRSSYGNGFTDEQFARNRKEATRLDIPRGFYHYAYPNHNSPEAEADWFTHVVGVLQKGELLFLDFEEKYPDPVGWSKRFLDRLSENYGGYKPLIYMNKFLTQSYNWSSVIEKSYGLWLAWWNDSEDFSSIPWPVVAFKQYSNNGTYEGISGRVDENIFYGDMKAFYKYGFQTETDPCKAEVSNLKTQINDLTKIIDDKDLIITEKQLRIELGEKEFLVMKKEAEKWENEYKEKVSELVECSRTRAEIKNELDTLKDIEIDLRGEIERLKAQKYTVPEALGLLINSLFKKGGDDNA